METTARQLKRIVEAMCNGFGVRLAGSSAEHAAAEYLAQELRQYAPKVWGEEYPVRERVVRSETLEVFLQGTWRECPTSLMGTSPTTGGQTLEGEVVFFDTATGYQADDLSGLTGKAVVHLGCHIENEDNYRRLMAAKPAFLLFVDTRFPTDNPLADGLFPAYVAKFGAIPSLKLSFADAWQWRTHGISRARVCVKGELRNSSTPVVIAELPGEPNFAGTLYAAGHIDTQAGTVGADDNAGGCAAVVALARLLAQRPHRRTIRLCCFGAEEQLSAGSAAYMRAHRKELEDNGIFICNFDTFGSALGWARFTVNGQEPLRQKIRRAFQNRSIPYQESTAPMPYTDQFPFAACGVPGMWVARVNCENGTFYHHRCDDTPDKLDFSQMAQYVLAAKDLLEELADAEELAGLTAIPQAAQQEITRLFQEVYGD